MPEHDPELWKHFVDELKAVRTTDQLDWGEIREEQVARFIAGNCSAGEAAEVERAMGQYPDLREVVQGLRNAPDEKDKEAGWVGLTLSERYKVLEKLGAGGMGLVYLARDLRLNSKVVIKAPRSELLSQDRLLAERFAREIKVVMEELELPHVVRVLDYGRHEGIPFAVLQYLAEGTLDDRQTKDAKGAAQGMPPDSLSAWLPDVARTLDDIHAQSYVHRDIKPENILFHKGKVYISDFGIATAIGEMAENSRLTAQGIVVGTVPYMAPEAIWKGKHSPKSDQYALAITVYEWLIGKVPFRGRTVMEICSKQRDVAAPRLDRKNSDIPAALADAVERALAKTPDERFPSCQAFAEKALSFLSGAPPVEDKVAAGKPPPPPKPPTVSKPLSDRELATATRTALTQEVARPKEKTRKRRTGKATSAAPVQAGWRKPLIWTCSIALAVVPPLVLALLLFFGPASAEQLLAQGWAAFEARDFDGAMNLFDEAASSNPSLGEPYVGKGRVHLESNRLTEAQAAFDEALRLDPQMASALVYRAQAHMAKRDFPQAISDCNSALRLEGKLAIAYAMLGKAHLGTCEFSRAVADFDNALSLDRNLTEARVDKAFAQLMAAYMDDSASVYDQVIVDCTQILQRSPQLARAHAVRGLAYAFSERGQPAVLDCKTAIEIDANCALAYAARARAYADLDKYDSALADCELALSRDPYQYLALEHRGYTNEKQQEDDKAITAYTQAITLEPRYGKTYYRRGVLRHNFGKMLIEQEKLANVEKQFLPAAQDFTRFLEFVPQPKIYNHRGLCRHILADHDNAIADFTKAIDASPKEAEYYRNRGLSYYHSQNKEYDKAVQDYTQALNLHEDSEVYRLRGDAHRARGNFQPALQDYSAAIRLRPSAENFEARGNHYFAARDYLKAFDDFNSATRYKASPKAASKRLFMRGLCFAFLGQLMPALGDLHSAVCRDESNKDAESMLDNLIKNGNLDRVELGKLTKSSSFDPATGKYFNAYSTPMETGKHYQINLASSDFNSCLQLLDANGKRIAENDDSGNSLNARLVYSPDRTDKYRIVATTSGRGDIFGSYVLAIDSKPMVLDKQVIPGEFTEQSNKRAATYAWQLDAGRTYLLELTSSDFEPLLKIEDSKGMELKSAKPSKANADTAQIVFEPSHTDSYRVVAAPVSNTEKGKFKLSAQKLTRTTTPPFAKTETIKSTSPTYRFLRSFMVDQQRFIAGRSYRIDAESTQLNPTVAVEFATGTVGNYLAVDKDGGEGTNARLLFTPSITGLYRVFVMSQPEKAEMKDYGACTLRIQEFQGIGSQDHVPTVVLGPQSSAVLRPPYRRVDFLLRLGDRKSYSFELMANTTYTIEMASVAFDTFLEVYDQSGNRLMFDDDGGGLLNSRILFRPARSGAYRITAGCYRNLGAGLFSISVR